MRNVRRRGLLIAGAVSASLLCVSADAWACRCPASVPTATSYGRADLIVTGMIASVTPNNKTGAPTAVVTVSKAWKKESSSTLRVSSTDTSCAFEFVAGREYELFLFATPDEGYATSLCAGNVPLDRASRALSWLGSHGTSSTVRRN
jgi:hypothetical protein